MPSSKGAERFGQLRVEVFDIAAELGRASAQNTAQVIRERVSLQGSVPEHRKASAVRAALIGPVSPACPASVLREHPNAVLFLDGESSSLLESSSRESED
jgi:glucosamine-6-phosphate deaminase